MRYLITKKTKTIEGEIDLPTSKSISNRVLVVSLLSGGKFDINNLSESDDTKVMKRAFDIIKKGNGIIDIGPAGTAMRFLTALLSITNGEFELTGSARMKRRPVEKLVNALKCIGADIEYLENEGYPPLKIRGKELKGGKLSIDGSISSQYISALLLIAPRLREGFELNLENRVISSSYIKLTLKILEYFGIKYEWSKNKIVIHNQEFIPRDIDIEGDWSGASYWYECAAFAGNLDLELSFLKKHSFQGDSKIAQIFEKVGVASLFKEGKVFLQKNGNELDSFELNFNEIPDMVQTFVVTLCFLNVPFRITGTESLKIKETDRIEALKNEMKKFGFVLSSSKPEEICWDGGKCEAEDNPVIETYEDHRMAMAFAPIALKTGKVIINEPGVVSKSYPTFWEDMASAGFKIEEL